MSGRGFESTDGQDPNANPPVIINQALARQFFPGEEPVGKTLVLDYDIVRDLEVIGVVADMREGSPGWTRSRPSTSRPGGGPVSP